MNEILNYTQRDATFLDLLIFTEALHVSGGSSAHHQEHVTLLILNYTQRGTTFLDLFIFTEALHVSGGSSAHHQEHVNVHTA